MAGAPSNPPPFGRLHQRRLISLALPVKASPPLLVSFSSLDDALAAMPEQFREGIAATMHPLVDQGLPPALSPGVVAALFGVSVGFVQAITVRTHRYYREFEIRKGKKRRSISAPKVALKLFQSWIGTHLANAVKLPECVLGFVPGHNGVLEAAERHSGATWVYSVDLRDFFSNVSRQRVEQALQGIGYSERASAFVAQLCTLNQALPQGSPASPVLSNMAFTSTDAALAAIADQASVRYTRYADDLVFSGDGTIPPGLEKSVKDCLSAHGWPLANEKVHLAVLPARLKVHGLLVHGTRPRLTKGYRNRIRAYRHLVAAGRIDEKDKAKIAGHIAYADQVERGSGQQK